MRPIRVIVALLLALTSLATRAQIDELRTVNGKQIDCSMSGLTSSLKDCGPMSWAYAYVFTGTIASITPIPNSDEKTLELIPNEVFAGSPPATLTVQTQQALCADEPLHVGDRWLFRLRREEGKPIIVDLFAGSGGPLTNKTIQSDVDTYRRLKTIGNLGLLRGEVVRGEYLEGKPIPNAIVTAANLSNGSRFTVSTDSEGRYEFQPLLPGHYDLTVTPICNYQPDPSYADVKAGACWDVTLDRESHAEISGRISHADGSPAAKIDIVLIEADNSGYVTQQTDDEGRFDFDSDQPGKYILGVNFPARPDWFNGSGAGQGVKLPPASWFYPGVDDRSRATVITLKTDQKLNNIDLVLPSR